MKPPTKYPSTKIKPAEIDKSLYSSCLSINRGAKYLSMSLGYNQNNNPRFHHRNRGLLFGLKRNQFFLAFSLQSGHCWSAGLLQG